MAEVKRLELQQSMSGGGPDANVTGCATFQFMPVLIKLLRKIEANPKRNFISFVVI